MKRDDDLIRSILLEVEKTPPNREVPNIQIPGRTEDEVLEHIEMMIDAGLLDGHVTAGEAGDERLLFAHVERLTWEGHEFLQNVRDERVWKRVKQAVREQGGTASLEVVKALAKRFALDLFGLPDSG